MTITSDDTSARWTDDDGYTAEVSITDRRDDRGAPRWAWTLRWPTGEAHSVTGDTINTWEDDPLDVLASLASFLSAWEEGLDWERRYPGRTSENGTLFHRACIEFMPAIEEFSLWAYDHESEEEEESTS